MSFGLLFCIIIVQADWTNRKQRVPWKTYVKLVNSSFKYLQSVIENTEQTATERKVFVQNVFKAFSSASYTSGLLYFLL